MKHKNVSGFTLVELLVVITLLGIIGTITTQVFILGIRSQGKSEVMKEVKQNGDYVYSVIEAMVRNAADIQSQCNTNTDMLKIVNPDGYTTTFDCSSGAQIASISGGTVPTPQPSPTGLPLTEAKIAVTNCTFRVVCPTPPLSPKYIFINFSVSHFDGSLTPTPGGATELQYESTFSLGNYK